MTMKFRFKVRAPQTAYDGWLISVFDHANERWVRVPHFVTDGHGASFVAAFDSREQAVKAASRYASRPEFLRPSQVAA